MAPNRLCPRCGSLERYRALQYYLSTVVPAGGEPTVLLDVATKQCFRDYCEAHPSIRYVSSDLMTQGAMVFSDLTQMGLASGAFDVITCLHVLEHIPADFAAFREIGRLLKPAGFAIIVVPLRGERTDEDPDAPLEERQRRFGQFDHVRYYGMDIVARMKAAGLDVEVIDLFRDLPTSVLQRHGIHGDDRYFFRVSPRVTDQ